MTSAPELSSFDLEKDLVPQVAFKEQITDEERDKLRVEAMQEFQPRSEEGSKKRQLVEMMWSRVEGSFRSMDLYLGDSGLELRENKHSTDNEIYDSAVGALRGIFAEALGTLPLDKLETPYVGEGVTRYDFQKTKIEKIETTCKSSRKDHVMLHMYFTGMLESAALESSIQRSLDPKINHRLSKGGKGGTGYHRRRA